MKTKILQNIFLSLGVTFALAITVHAQNLYVSVNGPLGPGNTDGSISEYTPSGMQITFTSGIPRPRGLAFDSGGNLFAGVTYQNPGVLHAKILKFPLVGHVSVLGGASQSFAEGVVTDGAGNVFALVQDERSETLASIIYKFAPDGTRTIFGTTPGQSFDIAFDASGNLYAADAGEMQTVYKFAPDGTRTVFAGPDAFPDGDPEGLAFDKNGNLFVSTEGDPGNDTILEFTPAGMETTFATGLTQPRGLAFDSSGNLFVAETLGAPLGDILKFTPNGEGSVFATGIARPEFLAFGPAR